MARALPLLSRVPRPLVQRCATHIPPLKLQPKTRIKFHTGLPLLSTDWDVPPTCVVNCGRPQVGVECVCTFDCMCTHSCVYVRVCVFVCVYTRAYTRVYTHACVHLTHPQVLITNIGGALVRFSRPSDVTPEILYRTPTPKTQTNFLFNNHPLLPLSAQLRLHHIISHHLRNMGVRPTITRRTAR